MELKYKIVDFLFGEDIGDLIYNIKNNDFKEVNKIVKYLKK